MCILRWFVAGCLAIAGDTVKLFCNREQNPLLGSELSLDYSCTSDGDAAGTVRERLGRRD